MKHPLVPFFFVRVPAAIWGVCVMRPKSMAQLQRSSELIFLSAWPQAFEKCAPTAKLCFSRWFLCHLLGRIYSYSYSPRCPEPLRGSFVLRREKPAVCECVWL